MIKVNTLNASVMECTRFRIAENATEKDLLQAISDFENQFLAHLEGIAFHCLAKNDKGEYANILLAQNTAVLTTIEKDITSNPGALSFLKLIDKKSVIIHYLNIEKEPLLIPENFSCVELGTFALKKGTLQELLAVSDSIEKNYLSHFPNTQLHFIGTLPDDIYAEVTFGTTLQSTQQICAGYLSDPNCTPLMEMIDETRMALDFWSVLA
ncbi:hypothetical protein [Flavobacterium cerinum]|uniref:DUF3822 family protein n=1 Tax=Flavobacterium cerinum TaxID=2502784 RepID=A0ABY5ITN9_9FLAO|nr:hypothetical protein [Flavobacterium cerinum]UUC45108.1 hypothetical protein NOX80_15965 [Flavobacterium cerinum]